MVMVYMVMVYMVMVYMVKVTVTWRKFVQTIVPLLIECWVEATTTQHFSTADGNGLHG